MKPYIILVSIIVLFSFERKTRIVSKKIRQSCFINKRTEDNYVYFKDSINNSVIEFIQIFNAGLISNFPKINKLSYFNKDSTVVNINGKIIKLPNNPELPDLMPNELGVFYYDRCNYIYVAEEYISFSKLYGWSYIIFKRVNNSWKFMNIKQFKERPTSGEKIIGASSEVR